jgi:putative transposase
MIIGMKTRRGAHTVYRLAYHFVWIPRSRRAILTGSRAARLEELIRAIGDARAWVIAAVTIQPDHGHLFVICPPRDAPAAVMNVRTSVPARELFAAYRMQLRRTHWGGKLWADGDDVGFAGNHVTADLIKRAIQDQESEREGYEPSGEAQCSQ